LGAARAVVCISLAAMTAILKSHAELRSLGALPRRVQMSIASRT